MKDHDLFEYDKYSKAMKSGVPAMMLVQAHLLTEHYLNQIISICLERGEKLIKNGKLSYFQKTLLVESLDKISDRIIQSLKDLNSIRNKCAHEIDKDISLSDIDRIGRNFGKDFIPKRKQHINNHRKLLGDILGSICAMMLGEICKLEDEIIKNKST